MLPITMFFVTQLCAVDQPQEVVVATTLPLQAEGRLIEMGMQAAFRQINEKDAPRRRFRLISSDDNKKAHRALENIERLKQQTPFFLGLFTTGVVARLLGALAQEQLVVFGPDENSTNLYSGMHDHLVLTKPSMHTELAGLIDYAMTKNNHRKFAVFYEESAYGRGGRDDVRALLKAHNLKPVAEVSYVANTVEVQQAAQALAQAKPDAIICIARRHATYNLTLEVINNGLFHAMFLGTSYLVPIQRFLKRARGVDFVATSVVPQPEKSMVELARSYRQAMQRSYPDQQLSPLSFLAYYQALLFADIAESVEGELTAKKFVAQAKKYKKKLKGVVAFYDPKTANMLHGVWLSPGHSRPWHRIKQSCSVPKREDYAA